MGDWLSDLADVLEQAEVSRAEERAVLRFARDVAHGIERRLAPLSAYAVGVYVGRRTTQGAAAGEALHEAIAAAATIIPGSAGEQDHI
ncbi:hypothetical protein BH20ACT24_BH20ACT24_06290 [soil metagenome]